MKKRIKGILLVNLGTPDAPDANAVGRYLKQFLMDPLVVDIPAPLRWALVHLAIVPKRKHTSAEAYQKVWTNEGSPLLKHTRDLAMRVQEQLEESHMVCYAMRYGSPSIEKMLSEMDQEGLENILVVPLYPQSTFSSNVTVIQEVMRVKDRIRTPLFFAQNFFLENGLSEVFARRIRESVDHHKLEKVVFSFHGLPERHILKADKERQLCLMSQYCCEQFSEGNKNCYRAQCYESARKIAAKASLSSQQFVVGFQSRLGRTPWIQPYADHLYQKLAVDGVKRIAVTCPSFVSDCLETLEEVAIRAREDFISMGGEELILISAPNSSADFVQFLVKWMQHSHHVAAKVFEGQSANQILKATSESIAYT